MDKDAQIAMLKVQVSMMESTTNTLNMIVRGLESQLDIAQGELDDYRRRLEELGYGA